MNAIRRSLMRRLARLRWKLLKARILSLNQHSDSQTGDPDALYRSECTVEYIVTPIRP